MGGIPGSANPAMAGLFFGSYILKHRCGVFITPQLSVKHCKEIASKDLPEAIDRLVEAGDLLDFSFFGLLGGGSWRRTVCNWSCSDLELVDQFPCWVCSGPLGLF